MLDGRRAGVKKGMTWSRLSVLPLLAVALVLLGLEGAESAWASAAPPPPVPVVRSAGATPATLSASGGVVTVAGTVENATTCQLQLLSTQSFPVVFAHNTRSCSNGTFSAQVTVGPNTTPVQRTVAFDLVASNSVSTSVGRFYVLLAAAKPAAVLSATATPAKLPAAGGVVTVAARVENATTCQLQLLSTQSFPVVYSHNAEVLFERDLLGQRHHRPQ